MAESRNASRNNTGQTFAYFGWLTLFVYLSTPIGYLIDIQTTYLLKNQLHASATQVSIFRLITGVPVYFAFVFGLARDLWNPLGMRDRGFFVIFAPATALAFAWMAYGGASYRGLLAGMILAMIASRFLAAAYQGLLALVGQESLMSGRLAVLWQVVAYVPYMAGAFASGYISSHLRPQQAFLLAGVLSLAIAGMGLWKASSVFSHTYERPESRGTNFVGDVRRLVRHWAIYPAVTICFLWNFAPGAQTALQFYLSDTLHLPDAVYSDFYGVFTASFIPTLFLYGYLCKRVPLNKLLWWGTIVAVPQMVSLVLVHSANLALVVAASQGLLGGVATGAYFDLAMRSCPPGLQGTLMMLVEGMMQLSMRGGDLLGAKIYNSSPAHGFLYCVIATTVVYALILPLIPLIPKELIATRDGEPNPLVQAEVLAEIAEPDAAASS